MIRAFTPEDAGSAAEMLRASFDAAYRGHAEDAALDDLLASVIPAKVLSSVTERADRGAVALVVDDGDSIVGYSVAGPSRDDDRDPNETGEIYSLYVHPRAWRAGVGRALQREGLEHLRLSGGSRADLWVVSSNQNASEFYARTGWADEGVEKTGEFLSGVPMRRYTRTLPRIALFDPTADARAIAEVHVAAWQDAYRGQIPDDYLDGLKVEDRERFWSERTSDSTYVAWLGGELSGFVSMGASRDDDAGAADFELYAINLRASDRASGAGLALLRTGESALRAAGAVEATLWVLDTNARARRFYEREGWALDGAEQPTVLGGAHLRELRYRKSL